MIHRIHRGEDLTRDFTIFGFGGTPNNFNEVGFPGDRRACTTCHVDSTYQLPLPDDRFTLTINDNLLDPANNPLDGESNVSEPREIPTFPSGDFHPGTDFVARFTVERTCSCSEEVERNAPNRRESSRRRWSGSVLITRHPCCEKIRVKISPIGPCPITSTV